MQCYLCIKDQHFDLAQFLDNDELPLPGKVKKLFPQFTCCRSIPWKVLLSQPIDVVLSCITVSCVVISCNCISPFFSVCIFVVSATTYVKSFPSRLRPCSSRHITKPCKTQSLFPGAWMLHRQSRQGVRRQSRGAEVVCSSFAVFWHLTGKSLNSAAWLPHLSQMLYCTVCEKLCKNYNSKMKKGSVGAQHRQCVIQTMCLVSKLGFGDLKHPVFKMFTLHLVKCSVFCVLTTCT